MSHYDNQIALEAEERNWPDYSKTNLAPKIKKEKREVVGTRIKNIKEFKFGKTIQFEPIYKEENE